MHPRFIDVYMEDSYIMKVEEGPISALEINQEDLINLVDLGRSIRDHIYEMLSYDLINMFIMFHKH